MDILIYLLTFALLAIEAINSQKPDCSRFEYDRCVKIADPLVKEAHLVFPDNVDDIDLVCRTWNKFVDCLKRYTDICFTDQQRRQFNKAVENPIESVHQMCMQPQYQKEYLQHAPCIKSTITERSHCGPHYNLLVELVAQGEIISKTTLCCSHDRFKQCVNRETRRLCDRGMQEGPASKFAGQILDKALSFLQDQCLNYIPNSGDCHTPMADSSPFTDPMIISTAPSEVFPWSTIQENNNIAKEVPPGRLAPPKPSSTWLPSAPSASADNNNNYQTDSSNQMLGSRTRPASYGRSSSWSENPSTSPRSHPNDYGNTIQMYPEVPKAVTTSSPKPDWATISTWNVINRNPSSVDSTQQDVMRSSPAGTETWYPAAGNQITNEVDEPNQQGLSYSRNNRNNNNGAAAQTCLGPLIILTAAILISC